MLADAGFQGRLEVLCIKTSMQGIVSQRPFKLTKLVRQVSKEENGNVRGYVQDPLIGGHRSETSLAKTGMMCSGDGYSRAIDGQDEQS